MRVSKNAAIINVNKANINVFLFLRSLTEAQKEMAQSDILVCGKCHSVFHFIDLFKEHKTNNCKRTSAFKDCVSKNALIYEKICASLSSLIIHSFTERNASKNLGLSLMEANSIPSKSRERRWRESVEALSTMDDSGWEYSTILACCWWNNSIVWEGNN